MLNKQITKDWVFFQNTQTAAVRLFLFQKFYIVYERKKNDFFFIYSQKVVTGDLRCSVKKIADLGSGFRGRVASESTE